MNLHGKLKLMKIVTCVLIKLGMKIVTCVLIKLGLSFRTHIETATNCERE